MYLDSEDQLFSDGLEIKTLGCENINLRTVLQKLKELKNKSKILEEASTISKSPKVLDENLKCETLASLIWQKFNEQRSKTKTLKTTNLFFKVLYRFLQLNDSCYTDEIERKFYQVACNGLVRRILKTDLNIIFYALKSGNVPLMCITLKLLSAIARREPKNCEEIWKKLSWGPTLCKNVFDNKTLQSKTDNVSGKPPDNSLISSYLLLVSTLLDQNGSGLRNSILSSHNTWGWSRIVQRLNEIKEVVLRRTLVILKKCSMDSRIERITKIRFYTPNFLRQTLELLDDDSKPYCSQKAYDLINTLCYTSIAPGTSSQYVEYIGGKSSKASKSNKRLYLILKLIKPTSGEKKQDLLVNICTCYPKLISVYFSLHSRFISSLQPGLNNIWLNFSSLITRIIMIDSDLECLLKSNDVLNKESLLAVNIPTQIPKSLIVSSLYHKDEAVKYSSSVIICYVFEKFRSILERTSNIYYQHKYSAKGKNLRDKKLRTIEEYVNILYERLPDFQVVLSQLISLNKCPPSKSSNKIINVTSPQSCAPNNLQAALLRITKYYLIYFPLKFDALRFDFKKLYTVSLRTLDGEVLRELLDIVVVTSISSKWHIKPAHMKSSILRELLLIHIFELSNFMPSDDYPKILFALSAVLRNSPIFEKRNIELAFFLDSLKHLKFVPNSQIESLLSWLNTALFISFTQTHSGRYANLPQSSTSCLHPSDLIVNFIANALGSMLKKWNSHHNKEFDTSLMLIIAAWASNYIHTLLINNLTHDSCIDQALDTIRTKFLSGSDSRVEIDVVYKFINYATRKKEQFSASETIKFHNQSDLDNLISLIFSESPANFPGLIPSLVQLAERDQKYQTLLKDLLFAVHPLVGSIYVNFLSVYGEFKLWPKIVLCLALDNVEDSTILLNLYAGIECGKKTLEMLNEVVDYVVSNKCSAIQVSNLIISIQYFLQVCVKNLNTHLLKTMFFINVAEKVVTHVTKLELNDYSFASSLVNDNILSQFALFHLNPSLIVNNSLTDINEIVNLSARYAKTISKLIFLTLKKGAPKSITEKFTSQYNHLLLQVFKDNYGTEQVNENTYFGNTHRVYFNLNELVTVAIYLGNEKFLNMLTPRLNGVELASLFRNTEITQSNVPLILNVSEFAVRELSCQGDNETMVSVINSWISNYELNYIDDINDSFGSLVKPCESSKSSFLKLRIVLPESLKLFNGAKQVSRGKLPCKLIFSPYERDIISLLFRCGATKSLSRLLHCGMASLDNINDNIPNGKNNYVECDLAVRILSNYAKDSTGNIKISQKILSYLSSCLEMCLGCYVKSKSKKKLDKCANHVKSLISRFPYKVVMHAVEQNNSTVFSVPKIMNIENVIPCLTYYYPILSKSFLREKNSKMQVLLDAYTLNVVNTAFEVFNGELYKIVDLISAIRKHYELVLMTDSKLLEQIMLEIIKDTHLQMLNILLSNLLKYGNEYPVFAELLLQLYFNLFKIVPETLTSRDALHPKTAIKLVIESDSYLSVVRELSIPTINDEERSRCEEVMTYLIDALIHVISCEGFELNEIINLEPILDVYNATQKPLDRKICELLYKMESKFNPGVNNYISGWKNMHNKGYDYILKKIDSTIMLHTIEFFDPKYEFILDNSNKMPMNKNMYIKYLQSSFSKHKKFKSKSALYDPNFLIPLATTILRSSDAKEIRDYLILIQKSNILGLAVMYCSSLSPTIRCINTFFIDLYLSKLNGCKNSLELVQTKLIIDCLKNSIIASEELLSKNNGRLPTLATFFLAQSIAFITKPESFMYKPLNKFFLKNPTINLNKPGMLNESFNCTNDISRQLRLWINHILSRGIACTDDLEYYERGSIINTIISAYNSPFSDAPIRRLTISVLVNISSMNVSMTKVLKNTSIVSFLEQEIVKELSNNHNTINLQNVLSYSTIILNFSTNLAIHGEARSSSEFLLVQAMTTCIKHMYYYLYGLKNGLSVYALSNGIYFIIEILLTLIKNTNVLKTMTEKNLRMHNVFLITQISETLDDLYQEYMHNEPNLKENYNKFRGCVLDLVLSEHINLTTEPLNDSDYSHFSRQIEKVITYVIDLMEAIECSKALLKSHCISCSNWIEELIATERNLGLLSHILYKSPNVFSRFMDLLLKLEISGFASLYEKLNPIVSQRLREV